MAPLRILPVTLIRRDPDEQRALDVANGLDLRREDATDGALLAFGVVLLALVVTLLAG